MKGGGNCMKLDIFDWLAILLVIIGALNLGLIGLFNFDFISAALGGPMTFLSKIVYSFIGLAGAYMIYLLLKLKRS